MAITVYNTLTRRKEPFETLEAEKVRMYVCGPTVYAAAHIGHAMSALVFDIIRRYLEYRGYQVLHVMNYTDVDDKIIDRAREQGVDPFQLAESYIREFDRHLEDLGILPATSNPRATREMDRIIEMIEGLIERGFGYPAEGDVYFRVRGDEDYGQLSGRRLEDMRSGSRIEVDERKEDPLDFALWKAAKQGEPYWTSPWGNGRPGWHIECSAMNLGHLGEQIDIHGGGNDLIFPHHENEIAQSESFSGKRFARYWVHNGMVQLAGEKMSKSLGNLITVRDFLARYPGEVLRMMVLGSTYRSPLLYGDQMVEQAVKALERLRGALKPALGGGLGAQEPAQIEEQIAKAGQAFETAMDDDFNTPAALAVLFDLVRTINQARDSGANEPELKPAQDRLIELSAVLGLELETSGEGSSAEPFIDLLLEVRTQLREAKLWEQADAIRDRLEALGVVLEDTPRGTQWSWKIVAPGDGSSGG